MFSRHFERVLVVMVVFVFECKLNIVCDYKEIKSDVLATYWEGCKNFGRRQWEHRQVVAWALEEFNGAYDHPFEKLMFHVIALGLGGAWSETLKSYHHSQCVSIIEQFKGVLPFDLIDAEDESDLRMDLQVFGISYQM